jgi:hypothetical protein
LGEDLTKDLEKLEKEKEALYNELIRSRSSPSGRIALLLFLLGLFSIALSVDLTHELLAYVGTALILWGGLFYYIRPTKFVRRDVLLATVPSNPYPIEKLLKEFEYSGTPQYISPNNLWGLKNTLLFIPKNETLERPGEDELSPENVSTNNPQGIKLTPPGHKLSKLIEEEMRLKTSSIDLEYLKYNLGKIIVQGLELAKTFNMDYDTNKIFFDTEECIFVDYSDSQQEEKVTHIGDPYTSALACIISRTTRNPVIIEKIERDIENQKLTTEMKLLN